MSWPRKPVSNSSGSSDIKLVEWVKELKRRSVVQVTGVYLVFAWGASLGLADLLPTFNVPDWIVRAAILGLFLLTPVVAALAWYFELTQQGVIRDPADLPQAPAGERSSGEIDETLLLQGILVRWQVAGKEQLQHMDAGFTLGRDPKCDITIDNPRASRQHVRIELEEEQWVLYDLNSRNGTWLDDQRVQRQILDGAHTVRLGGGTAIELQIF